MGRGVLLSVSILTRALYLDATRANPMWIVFVNKF